MTDLLFEDDDMKEREGRWPVEVLVTVGGSNQLSILDRESYKEILTETLPDLEDRRGGAPGEGKGLQYVLIVFCYTVTKKQRLEEEEGCPLVCLSPNACCVLVMRGHYLQLYQIISPILGPKG